MRMARVLDKIEKIEFRMMSPENIRGNSVVNIINPELYDLDGFPIEGGLMDPRMGVIDPGIRCRTCGGRVKECNGHFGNIELARPTFHYEYASLIYNFLRGTCQGCGNLMVDEKTRTKYVKELKKTEEDLGFVEKWKKVKLIVARLKAKTDCPHCELPKEKITYEKPTRFLHGKEVLTPIDVREWFERIKDEDCEILGLDPISGRPEWMILTVINVPPVTVRPSITLQGGQRSEDDLTHKLGDIVRTNQRLYENLTAGAPAPIIEDLWSLLQYHVTTFFDNEISQVPPARHRSGRPLRTLTSRLKGKEGRFRQNLAGKRVNFSSRAVISPDPEIAIDEVGIPYEVATELTIPTRVTEWNKDYLSSLIKNGETYPGANYVITSDGKRKKITESTTEVILEELEAGFIVERHLLDGDIVLFNRQPSLHKMSIMGHHVKVLPGKSFRLNISTTTPYNADFDGDEMNLHVPQTEEARAEAKFLMDVNEMIVSPRDGRPIIGAIEDQVSGLSILTSEDFKLSRARAINLLFECGIEEEFAEEKSEYDGSEIFSITLPKDLDFETDKIIIKKGQLVSGSLDASAVGKGGKLLHHIYLMYGPNDAAIFLQKANLLGIKTLGIRGFTVRISDLHVPMDVRKEVSDIKKGAIKITDDLVKQYESEDLEPLPGRTLRETLELKIVGELNKARNKATRIVGNKLSESQTNDAMIMVKTRAKGSLLNVGLMNAFNGQTSLRGMRITKGYVDRVFPHHVKGNLGAKEHGFIENGFIHGLTPFEFFMMAITGRSSIMDKALATPRSGYLQRRLVNSLQDLRVNTDLSVRDDWNNVIQFTYGDDGFDVSKTYLKEFVKIPVVDQRIIVEMPEQLVEEEVVEEVKKEEKPVVKKVKKAVKEVKK